MDDQRPETGVKRSVAEERAEAQQAARARKAARRAEVESPDSAFAVAPVGGPGLLRLNEWSTLLFVVVAVAATALEPSVGTLRDVVLVTFVAVSLTLGVVGVGFFVLALVWGAQRSRESDMTMAGWWFLAGDTAPKRVRLGVLGCLGVQVVVSFAAAGVRPFTELAFGTLVPICALAIGGAWSAKYGDFPPRRTVTR